MPLIRQAMPEEAYVVAEFMTRFESETSHVKVDARHAGTIYESIISRGVGCMFMLFNDGGDMIGGLGCIKAPDLHYPRIIAVETYWYVMPEHRGVGIQLMEHFEQWAKDNGCDAVAFVHLSDSMPEILQKVYEKRGYKLIEQHFLKEI